MKLSTVNVIVLLLAILVLCEQNEVLAKKQKTQRGNEKSALKNNNNKGNLNRKTRDVGYENTKGNTYETKKQANNKNKNENTQGATLDNKQKGNNKKNYNNKKQYNIKNEQQNSQGEIKEEIKREVVDKKTEKYSKTIKQKNGKQVNKPLNGEESCQNGEQTVNENVKETPSIDAVENKVSPNEEEEVAEAVAVKGQNDNRCSNCASYTQEKLQECTNKKLDSIERNTTKVCEKYKSEKNTKVIQEKLISDQDEEVDAELEN